MSPEDKNIDEVEIGDFTIAKANLDRSTQHINVNIFNVATRNLKERVLKDGEDKVALKAENWKLQQYVSNLLHDTSQATLLLPQVLETSVDQH